jgi:hypothetical protein
MAKGKVLLLAQNFMGFSLKLEESRCLVNTTYVEVHNALVKRLVPNDSNSSFPCPFASNSQNLSELSYRLDSTWWLRPEVQFSLHVSIHNLQIHLLVYIFYSDGKLSLSNFHLQSSFASNNHPVISIFKKTNKQTLASTKLWQKETHYPQAVISPRHFSFCIIAIYVSRL